MTVGGRQVPGYVAQPGTPAALEGCEMVFNVCGPVCAAALTEAADDALPSVMP